MYPTLLDTETGQKVDAAKMDCSLFWWAEGNGSCDCNRAICLGEDIVDELTKKFGEHVCYGSERIIAIDVHGDLEGRTKDEALEEINESYPEELVARHLITRKTK
jgi:hypothetical protein